MNQDLINLAKTAERKGVAQGIEQGRVEGRLEGEWLAKCATANNLLQLGVDRETISKATGLSYQELEAIEKSKGK